MAKIPIFAHFFHCFRVLFERPSPFRALDTIDTDRKIAEKSINCPQYFISRFPQTLNLTKYKILKRTMGLQTGYFKNAAEVYLSQMTRHAPVTLLLFLGCPANLLHHKMIKKMHFESHIFLVKRDLTDTSLVTLCHAIGKKIVPMLYMRKN